MTAPTVATRPGTSPPDLNEAADAMARLFDLADEIRALPPERRPALISAFLAYTGHLAGLTGGTHDHETHVELADRLWMVCSLGVVKDHLKVCPSGPRTSSDGGAA